MADTFYSLVKKVAKTPRSSRLKHTYSSGGGGATGSTSGSTGSSAGGKETPGKCSPDGKLREYAWTRDMACRLESRLGAQGFDARRIVTEQTDVKLSERCARVNRICAQHGARNVLVVSLHNNAAGADGKWHTARGFSAHVSLNASDRSKQLAALLWDAAIVHGLRGDRAVPPGHYIAQNLAICRDTKCAAVLTENLFQDNRQDVDYLLSEAGMNAIIAAHVEAIRAYIAKHEA